MPNELTSNSYRNARRAHSRRRGATLLDVAAGSMLLAVILIPSAHLISQSQSCHARLTNRKTMMFEAENQLEATKIALSSPAAFDLAWSNPTDVIREVTVADGPDLKSRTRISADPTIAAPARLLTIDIEVWQDFDGDDRLDASEPAENIRTQWASP
tara:strand:- start:1073343 stop:1073813 length:471 start_codon:yes stop_codon:yes gene_type:complete